MPSRFTSPVPRDRTERRQCEEACTQHIDIVERLAEIAAWENAILAK